MVYAWVSQGQMTLSLPWNGATGNASPQSSGQGSVNGKQRNPPSVPRALERHVIATLSTAAASPKHMSSRTSSESRLVQVLAITMRFARYIPMRIPHA